MMMVRQLAVVPLLFLLWAFAQAPEDSGAKKASADLEHGKRLYQAQCGKCHGIDGSGGDAPGLNPASMGDDQAIAAVIKNGLPSRGMPANRMSDHEVRLLVAFVRSLGRTAPARAAGDAVRGKAVYDANDCAFCHVIEGQGRSAGPELTGIGLIRGADYLRTALLDPGAAMPKEAQGIERGGFTQFLPVRVTTSDGREVRGTRINEDTYTIQVRDADNRLYSFRKHDLKKLEKEFGKSTMPGYRSKLSDAEIEDLVAYLAGLRGGQ